MNTMRKVVAKIVIRRARNVVGLTSGTVYLAPALCYCRDRGKDILLGADSPILARAKVFSQYIYF